MAEFSGPWAGQPLPDNRYQRLFSEYGTGVLGDVAINGPIPVQLTAQADSLTVHPFEAVVRGRYYRIDSVATVTLAAPSAQRRIDRLVLRLDPTVTDPAATRLAVVQGAPAASSGATPQAPALTQTFDGVWEMPLAQVQVNPAAPTLSNLEYDAPYKALPILPVRTRTRPARANTGQAIWDMDLGRLLVRDAGVWREVAYVGPRFQTSVRSTDWANSVVYPRGSFTFVHLAVTPMWSSAPAGDYMVDAAALLSTATATGTSLGALRIRINGAVTDIRADLDGVPRLHRHSIPHTHSGGNLQAEVLHATNDIDGRVHGAGTRITVTYLGRRS